MTRTLPALLLVAVVGCGVGGECEEGDEKACIHPGYPDCTSMVQRCDSSNQWGDCEWRGVSWSGCLPGESLDCTTNMTHLGCCEATHTCGACGMWAMCECSDWCGTPCLPETFPRGECHAVHQCGCEEGEWCAIIYEGAFIERCFAGPPGIIEPGEPCEYDIEWRDPPTDCRPGTSCIEGSSATTCVEWCETSDDCSTPGTECSTAPTIGLRDYGVPGYWVDLPAPYRVCTLP